MTRRHPSLSQIKRVKMLLAEGAMNQREIASEAGVSQYVVRRIRYGKERSVFDAAFLSPRSEVAPALREAVKMEVLDAMPKR